MLLFSDTSHGYILPLQTHAFSDYFRLFSQKLDLYLNIGMCIQSL